ncbi:hypothetical protein ASF59_20080 [Methylobacterium sp. Leaf121]|nr:hypothetical protein ASF59_20080 [Methylobacterium sp. Leaf121]
MTRMLPLAALALACVASPAFAAELGTIGDTAVILPWGDWLVALAQMAGQILLPIVLPLLAAYVIQAIRKTYPWLALVLTQERLEQMGRALTDYGLNAIEGAAKGKTLSVDVGSRVVAAGVQRGLETVPPAVIKAAGGAEGIAKIIFRQLPLETGASAEKVIPVALMQAGAAADRLDARV